MSFTFNGINCETLGMFVERYPVRVFPERKATTISVPGRSGDVVIDEGAFANYVQPYEVYFRAAGNIGKSSAKIANWLLGSAGYKTLTDTYDRDGGVTQYARVINGAEFMNALNQFGKGTLKFDCRPQRYITQTKITGTTSGAVETITMTFPEYVVKNCKPLIKIKKAGSGAVHFDQGEIVRVQAAKYNVGVTILWVAEITFDDTVYGPVVIDTETGEITFPEDGAVTADVTIAIDGIIEMGIDEGFNLYIYPSTVGGGSTPSVTYEITPRMYEI